mgnify:CR=1 FL=1
MTSTWRSASSFYIFVWLTNIFASEELGSWTLPPRTVRSLRPTGLPSRLVSRASIERASISSQSGSSATASRGISSSSTSPLTPHLGTSVRRHLHLSLSFSLDLSRPLSLFYVDADFAYIPAWLHHLISSKLINSIVPFWSHLSATNHAYTFSTSVLSETTHAVQHKNGGVRQDPCTAIIWCVCSISETKTHAHSSAHSSPIRTKADHQRDNLRDQASITSGVTKLSVHHGTALQSVQRHSHDKSVAKQRAGARAPEETAALLRLARTEISCFTGAYTISGVLKRESNGNTSVARAFLHASIVAW